MPAEIDEALALIQAHEELTDDDVGVELVRQAEVEGVDLVPVYPAALEGLAHDPEVRLGLLGFLVSLVWVEPREGFHLWSSRLHTG